MQKTALFASCLLFVAGAPLAPAQEVAPATKAETPPKEDHAKHGPPHHRGRGHGRGDETFEQDHNVFFYLLEHRKEITREIKFIEEGVETVTESKDPKVAEKIREHVAAMYVRVEKNRPIHMRDPLFREVFRHADQIVMKTENTEHGIRVTETSKNPYVAKLIQEHAKVVSRFLKNGHAELRKNHAVPSAK